VPPILNLKKFIDDKVLEQKQKKDRTYFPVLRPSFQNSFLEKATVNLIFFAYEESGKLLKKINTRSMTKCDNILETRRKYG